jgi:hypothetical protein
MPSACSVNLVAFRRLENLASKIQPLSLRVGSGESKSATSSEDIDNVARVDVDKYSAAK